MADPQKEQFNKEHPTENGAPETARSSERAPEIGAVEKGPVASREKAGVLRQTIEGKPSGRAGTTAAPQVNDQQTKAKAKTQRLKKLRRADPKKFEEKLKDTIKKELEKDDFQQADDQHDETITNIRFN